MIFTNPAFYDFFGILFFSFLIFVSLKILNNKKLDKWIFKLILIVAIFGLIVDLTMVLITFFN